MGSTARCAVSRQHLRRGPGQARGDEARRRMEPRGNRRPRPADYGHAERQGHRRCQSRRCEGSGETGEASGAAAHARPYWLPRPQRLHRVPQHPHQGTVTMRIAFRLLARSPIFSLVAILSLAIGIGANTAIFTLINALVLRDLPVPEPDRLFIANVVPSDVGERFSYPAFTQSRDQLAGRAELCAMSTIV